MRSSYAAMLIAVLLAGMLVSPAGATDISLMTPTTPVASGISTAVETLLEADPPEDVTADWYVITAAIASGLDYYVSVSALDPDLTITDPDDPWLLDEDTVWSGMLFLDESSGSYTASYWTATLPPGTGGGNNIDVMPFQAGTLAVFGARGVHGAWGGSLGDGMLAVDWVGGAGYGGSSMPPLVYAADDGAVDYVCTDDYSMAVRTHNPSTGERFWYLHLLKSSNITVNKYYARGAVIGTLQSGSFCNTTPSPAGCHCGWASQPADVYHLHFGFDPDGSYYRAENWTLNVGTQVWANGSNEVRVGGTIAAGGVASTGTTYTGVTDTGTGTVMVVDLTKQSPVELKGGHVWDGFVMSALTVAQIFATTNFGPAGMMPSSDLSTIMNQARAWTSFSIRIANAFLPSVFNLNITMVCFSIILFNFFLYAALWVIRRAMGFISWLPIPFLGRG